MLFFAYLKDTVNRVDWHSSLRLHLLCLIRTSIQSDRLGVPMLSLPAPSMTEGLLVFVQLVMAAMTTEP